MNNRTWNIQRWKKSWKVNHGYGDASVSTNEYEWISSSLLLRAEKITMECNEMFVMKCDENSLQWNARKEQFLTMVLY